MSGASTILLDAGKRCDELHLTGNAEGPRLDLVVSHEGCSYLPGCQPTMLIAARNSEAGFIVHTGFTKFRR